ncbi:unnamed protein product [Lota lota]
MPLTDGRFTTTEPQATGREAGGCGRNLLTQKEAGIKPHPTHPPAPLGSGGWGDKNAAPSFHPPVALVVHSRDTVRGNPSGTLTSSPCLPAHLLQLKQTMQPQLAPPADATRAGRLTFIRRADLEE